MKPTGLLLPYFFLTIASAVSQNREVVVTRGFDNSALHADTFPGNQWVFATLSSPAQGQIYQDTITLRITDSLGSILQTITVPPASQEERHEILRLITLPDTSMLLIYGGGECDVSCCRHYFIEKWKGEGTMAWRLVLPDLEEQPGPVTAIGSSTLYIVAGLNVFEVDAMTGQITGSTAFAPFFTAVKEAAFIHGTRDLIAYHYDDSISHYTYDSVGMTGYSRTETKHLAVFLNNLKSYGDGNVYAAMRPSNSVISINSDLDFTMVADYPVQGRDFTPTKEGVITLIRNGDQYRMNFFDTNAILRSSHVVEHPQIAVYKIWSGRQEIGAMGVYTAGGNVTSPITSREAWFRIYPLDSPGDHASVYSVAITDIEQRAPVVHDSVYINEFNFTGYLENISGGDFRMLVQNTGDQPVDSFRINYHFGNDWFYWYCGLDQVKHVQYHIHLEPGAATWVDFGDVQSNNMFSVPDQFCFWTSGPSDRPDDAPEDDKHCTNWSVPVSQPTSLVLQISPNPADDIVTIHGIAVEKAVVSISSLDGTLLLQNTILSDHRPITVNTQFLPEGFFVLRVNEYATSLVIARN